MSYLMSFVYATCTMCTTAGPGPADTLVPLGCFTHLGCPEAYGQASLVSVGVAQRRNNFRRQNGFTSQCKAAKS